MKTSRFHLQYDLLMKYDFYQQKSWFHSRFEMNHIVNENFSFSKRIAPFQEGQLVVFSEMEHFRFFFLLYLQFMTINILETFGTFCLKHKKECTLLLYQKNVVH